MIIHGLSLKNYRNFSFLDLYLNNGVNIFYGGNAQGKTNLLEAVYFCSTGHTQRTNNHKDLISFDENEAHIKLLTRYGTEDLNFSNDYYVDKINIHLKREQAKGIAVNGVPIRKLSQLFGRLLTVIFSPEDLSLVKAGPSERRKYMDMELCQISPVYCHHIQEYYRVLKQRNNLLKNIRHGKMDKDTLFVWDEQLIQNGIKIIQERKLFMERINIFAGDTHNAITNGNEALSILYKPNTEPEDFAEKLNKNYERDLSLQTTHTGIHRDDLIFMINGVDTRLYGSQGQKRTASLSAKLAEIELIKEKTGHYPVLLLDDVLSELDDKRQKYLLKNLHEYQSIITCTGLNTFIDNLSTDYKVFKIENGNVSDY